MTKQKQKDSEIHFAENVARLMKLDWNVESAPNEDDWPDLVVQHKGGCFGLEVRNIYPDDSTAGSACKHGESININLVRNIADEYYRLSNRSIRANFLGDITKVGNIVKQMVVAANEMKDFEQKQIEPYFGCVVDILGIPKSNSFYRRWQYVSDKVGFVGSLEQETIQKRVDQKASNLEKYKNNIKDVRLLLVLDRTFNSGRFEINDSIRIDLNGFTSVYLLVDPECVYPF